MKEEDYDKIATVLPLGDIIDRYLSELNNALDDATTQAENGSAVGMAISVGKCKRITDDLIAAWASVKRK